MTERDIPCSELDAHTHDLLRHLWATHGRRGKAFYIAIGGIEKWAQALDEDPAAIRLRRDTLVDMAFLRPRDDTSWFLNSAQRCTHAGRHPSKNSAPRGMGTTSNESTDNDSSTGPPHSPLRGSTTSLARSARGNSGSDEDSPLRTTYDITQPARLVKRRRPPSTQGDRPVYLWSSLRLAMYFESAVLDAAAAKRIPLGPSPFNVRALARHIKQWRDLDALDPVTTKVMVDIFVARLKGPPKKPVWTQFVAQRTALAERARKEVVLKYSDESAWLPTTTDAGDDDLDIEAELKKWGTL